MDDKITLAIQAHSIHQRLVELCLLRYPKYDKKLEELKAKALYRYNRRLHQIAKDLRPD